MHHAPDLNLAEDSWSTLSRAAGPPGRRAAGTRGTWGYERWLDHVRDGKDNKALGLTSPATVATAPWGPRARAR
ncbi:hypothetical protein ADK55_30235 [Streptomyces sp. WM4235]|uniref:hypothetical protein n=1 Tax=Streptomyces sp. WM4235 TaxID=1415551 RepID=UPI0006AEF0B5|nr:hypothetical protein [Streptomyces sp. WM4235]KOU40978.1 hypothetical protein ADK55_30235 [Streptomyces sp. WM4235]